MSGIVLSCYIKPSYWIQGSMILRHWRSTSLPMNYPPRLCPWLNLSCLPLSTPSARVILKSFPCIYIDSPVWYHTCPSPNDRKGKERAVYCNHGRIPDDPASASCSSFGSSKPRSKRLSQRTGKSICIPIRYFHATTKRNAIPLIPATIGSLKVSLKLYLQLMSSPHRFSQQSPPYPVSSYPSFPSAQLQPFVFFEE